MRCEKCNIDHDGRYGSGRFCSQSCSRSFSTQKKRSLINEKVSSKLKGKPRKMEGERKSIMVEKICQKCGKNFTISWSKRRQKTCSVECGAFLKWDYPGYRENMSKINSDLAKKQHSKGTGIGWRTRKKLEPSYPEKIAIRTLDSLNVEYEYEMPFGKYFVDFAINDRMIAIEIDGRQHKKEERRKTDEEKDSLLCESGWKVYRILYPEENIKESIKNILAGIPSR